MYLQAPGFMVNVSVVSITEKMLVRAWFLLVDQVLYIVVVTGFNRPVHSFYLR